MYVRMCSVVIDRTNADAWTRSSWRGWLTILRQQTFCAVGVQTLTVASLLVEYKICLAFVCNMDALPACLERLEFGRACSNVTLDSN